jgi:flavorubredoxin
MGVIKLCDGVYSVGVLNPSLRLFDVIMETAYGTSYNAYLITGEKNVLIDAVHEDYFDEYLENIRSIIDPASIDYIIMNHNEPDHSGALSKLMDLAPGAELLTSAAGKIYLPLITNKDRKSVV